MHDRALVEGVAALPGTFLAALPPLARERLLADAVFHEIQAGSSIFSATEAMERTGVILRGMARTHLSSADGRRLSVRFARPGSLVGSLPDGRASLSVQAVVPCTILEWSLATLSELIAEDGRVGLALVAEMARRLRETYATLASNTFGSMRERVARQLLDLTTDGPGPARLVAPITQQGLADGVGTVREVVARVLRDFRHEGLIATVDGCIEIVDPAALALIVSGARPNVRLTMATAR
jgi:CRP/FNR family cyclic AMP-dependent transcriptional regulator